MVKSEMIKWLKEGGRRGTGGGVAIGVKILWPSGNNTFGGLIFSLLVSVMTDSHVLVILNKGILCDILIYLHNAI